MFRTFLTTHFSPFFRYKQFSKGKVVTNPEYNDFFFAYEISPRARGNSDATGGDSNAGHLEARHCTAYAGIEVSSEISFMKTMRQLAVTRKLRNNCIEEVRGYFYIFGGGDFQEKVTYVPSIGFGEGTHDPMVSKLFFLILRFTAFYGRCWLTFLRKLKRQVPDSKQKRKVCCGTFYKVFSDTAFLDTLCLIGYGMALGRIFES